MMNAGAWDGLYVDAYALGSAALLGGYVSFLAFMQAREWSLC